MEFPENFKVDLHMTEFVDNVLYSVARTLIFPIQLSGIEDRRNFSVGNWQFLSYNGRCGEL